MPEVEQRQAILAEESGDVVTPIGGNERIIGLAADLPITVDAGIGRILHVRDPDLTAIPEAEHEAVAGGIHQPDDLGWLGAVTLKVAGMSATGSRVWASKTRTPPGS